MAATSTARHVISNVNPDTQTLDCAACGPSVEGYYKAYRSQWACRKAKREHQVSATPEAAWRRSIKRKFGLDASGYSEMLEAQAGKCAICRAGCATGNRLAVDHDHETGVVRGLLCGRCNRAIGMFEDRTDLLSSAIDYLDTHARTEQVR